jgi:hypothetical protein
MSPCSKGIKRTASPDMEAFEEWKKWIAPERILMGSQKR